MSNVAVGNAINSVLDGTNFNSLEESVVCEFHTNNNCNISLPSTCIGTFQFYTSLELQQFSSPS